MEGEALLGPIPAPWKVMLDILPDICSREPIYWNAETKMTSKHDPRLGDIPSSSDWESIDQERTPDDPRLFAPHRNKVTGEVINSDPLLSYQALLDRGIELQKFPCLTWVGRSFL